MPEEPEASRRAVDAAAESVDVGSDRALSPYGIASLALGVVCVGALVMAFLIWSAHRENAAELEYQSRVAQTAVDWTGVLINMNSGNVDSSLQELHDRTVGALNGDFDRALAPYRNVVKTLQSTSAGQINSVSIESVHNDLDRRPGSPPPDPTMDGLASRTDTVLIVATSVTENVGAEARAIDWNLRIGVANVEGDLMISELEWIR